MFPDSEPLAGKTEPRRLWIVAVLVFFVLVLLTIGRHEMWFDELQAWMISHEASNLAELFQNLRYEGHPPGWHLLLYGVGRIGDDPQLMQCLHLLIATAYAVTFMALARLPLWMKWAFLFGYYPFYQYAVISRCYALGVLCLFIYCAGYCRRGEGRWWLMAPLLVGGISSFPVAALSLILGAFLLAELLASNRKADFIGAALLYLAALALVSHFMNLPADVWHFQSPGWHLELSAQRLGRNLTLVLHSYFVGTEFFLYTPRWWLSGGVGFLLVLLFAWTFSRRPRLMFLYLSGTFGLLTIFYIKYGERWHYGFLLIWLVVCLWLQCVSPGYDYQHPRIQKAVVWGESRQHVALGFVLAYQMAAGLYYASWDWFNPYSGSREAAEVIREAGLTAGLLITDFDLTAAPISGYLDRDIFYPQSNDFGTFIVWRKKRRLGIVAPEELLLRAKELSRERGRGGALILAKKLSEPLPDGVTLLAEIESPREACFLYRFNAQFGSESGKSPGDLLSGPFFVDKDE